MDWAYPLMPHTTAIMPKEPDTPISRLQIMDRNNPPKIILPGGSRSPKKPFNSCPEP